MSDFKKNITELGMMYTLQEMKNPLTNILLGLELLEAETDEDRRKGFYVIIKKNVLEMGAYITDLHKCFTDQDIHQSWISKEPVANDDYIKELMHKLEVTAAHSHS